MVLVWPPWAKFLSSSSYAAFSPGRNWEQIRTTICLNDRPVKIVGSHAGVSVGPDGATHQMLEDIALMRVLPNMVVIAPCDCVEAEKATLAMAADKRPNYLRLAREATPIITTDKTPFEIGKAYVFAEGADVTLIATGTMTYQALAAAEKLSKDGIEAEVIHVPTIKPLDEETILKSVRKTGAVVTAEEGQIIGGLGGAIAELLAEEPPDADETDRHARPLRRIRRTQPSSSNTSASTPNTFAWPPTPSSTKRISASWQSKHKRLYWRLCH